FFVQVSDLKLGFQIDYVIVLCPQPVARLGAVLAHHDDRRLDSSQAGENQIEENEWIGIECMRHKQDAVDGDPDEEDRAKCDEKFPTAAKLSDVIGEPLAESQLFLELLADVAGENFMLLQALDHFLVERGKL